MSDDISFPDGTPVYGTREFELGIDSEGDGYVTVRPKTDDDFEFTFSVEPSQVEEFYQQREPHRSDKPALSPPEDARKDVDVDDPWTTTLRHTGGGFWNREFWKKLDDGGRILIAYNPDHLNGLQVGYYKPDGDGWGGEIDMVQLDGPDPDEQDAIDTARTLMEKIDAGTYADRIEELAEKK